MKGPKTKHELYPIWLQMRHRCKSPNHALYGWYGARGITVCPRWDQSFLDFLHDMGERPSKSHSLDRIDNNGPYSPENCRWATKFEQARNMRTNVLIDILGMKLTAGEWSDLTGVRRTTIRSRLGAGYTGTALIEETDGRTGNRLNDINMTKMMRDILKHYQAPPRS